MKNGSLKHLQKHLRFCKKCQNVKSTSKLCEPIREYARQDYVRQQEQPVSQERLERTENDIWTNYIAHEPAPKLKDLIKKNLHLLTPLQAKIIHSIFWRGKKQEEIADDLNYASKSTIRYHRDKALSILRGALPSANSIHKLFPEVTEKLAPIASTEGEANS